LAGGGFAVAKSLIKSSDIADGSIQSRDVRKGTLSLSRMTPGTQALMRRAGTPGRNGASGPAGPQGPGGSQGPGGAQGLGGAGAPTSAGSGNWGIVNRNTIGSPFIDLRSGPGAGASGPPFGVGSLGFLVKDATEKAAYGNETDFAGQNVDDLTQVGFRVYTTGENSAAGGATPNMPSIAFEIDPNLSNTASASNFSTLVFVPGANSPSNQWSPYIDATTSGRWGLTGAAGTAGPCSLNAGLCTFAEVKAYLNDGGDQAKILTAQLTKGRDNSWQGAIDGLRVNDEVFDFEEDGVTVAAP
jgi:hypothetical protein